MKRGDRVATPIGPGEVLRAAYVVITRDSCGLKHVWTADEVRPLPKPEPDNDAAEERQEGRTR